MDTPSLQTYTKSELMTNLTNNIMNSKQIDAQPSIENTHKLILMENLIKENKLLRDELNGISCLLLIMKINQLVEKIE
jgi:hypothetical protein